MRLLVDARYVRPVHDGISRYTAGVLEGLRELMASGEAADLRVVMLISDRAQLGSLPQLPWVLGPSPTGPLEPLTGWWINRYRPDVFFSPMQTVGSWGRRYGLVLTLHDLIYYDHPEPPSFLPAPVRVGWRIFHRSYAPQRFLLDRADAVVTVSETTRAQMLAHRLTRRPIHVVPNAGPPAPEDLSRSSGTEGRDLLYMGSAMPYKRVEALIRAMPLLPGYRLHLLSRYPPARRAELAALVEDPAQVVFHDGVSEQEYERLLDRAGALVTASAQEGFGLPVIEAMSRAVPTVVSDIPIFREIAPHALHVDPEDPQELARAVRRLEDPRFRAELVERSREDAARYSWTASARQLLRVAREVQALRPSRPRP